MPGGDGDLVRGALAGEQAAFAELVARYRDAALGVAYHHLSSFDDAQDAAQEALVRAYLRLGQLRDAERFGPWLRRITMNVCADLLRRRGDRLLSLDAWEEPAAPPGGQEGDRLAARIVVRQALARLSEKARLTATLFYIDGYSQGEVAEFLEVPVETVRSRLRLARKQLREEMVTMVSDALSDGKPGPEFDRKVVDEALRRAAEASAGHRRVEALAHLDDALAAVERMPPGPERRRLEMDVLWSKGAASTFPLGFAEAARLQEQALAIAQELGERDRQAAIMVHVGATYASLHNRGKAEEYYRAALKLYDEMGNSGGHGQCLAWLGSQKLYAGQTSEARACYEQGIPLLESAGNYSMAGVCRAVIDLLDEVKEERFPSLLAWSATCTGLRLQGGTVCFVSDEGGGVSRREGDPPPELFVADPFYQVGQLRKLLDSATPVGGSWSGGAFSHSYQPLCAVMAVKSASEQVAVPAGTFDQCLLMEQVTTESGLPDEADERQKDLNRRFLCGTRQAWYAPGVGLVQLRVQTAAGVNALLQLQEFSVPMGGNDALPLTPGNMWVYTTANLPAGYAHRETYRVLAVREGVAYLEHYCWAMAL